MMILQRRAISGVYFGFAKYAGAAWKFCRHKIVGLKVVHPVGHFY